MKKKETAPESQSGDHAVDRTANGEPPFPQLPIDICRCNVVGESEIKMGEKSEELGSFTVLGIFSNALEDLLDNNAAGGHILSLVEARFQDLSFPRGFTTKEVNPHRCINQDPQSGPSAFPAGRPAN